MVKAENIRCAGVSFGAMSIKETLLLLKKNDFTVHATCIVYSIRHIYQQWQRRSELYEDV